MDIIAMLSHNEMTVEEAENIFDNIIDKIHNGQITSGWRKVLELSNYEATALLHGATLTDLVKVRYDGWPTHCSQCNLPLDYKKYGWFFCSNDEGIPKIEHIICPPKLQ